MKILMQNIGLTNKEYCYVMVFSVVVNYIGTNARVIPNNVLLTHKML